MRHYLSIVSAQMISTESKKVLYVLIEMFFFLIIRCSQVVRIDAELVNLDYFLFRYNYLMERSRVFYGISTQLPGVYGLLLHMVTSELFFSFSS